MKWTDLVMLTALLFNSAIFSRNGFACTQDASPASKSPEVIARLLAEQGKLVALPAPKGKVKQIIERNDKAHAFPSGESKAVLFKLPDFTRPYTLKLSSFCNCSGPSKSVFVPMIVLLDAEFKHVYQLEETDLVSKYESLEANIKMNAGRKADSYLLIYTRGDLVGELLGALRTFEGLLVRFNYPYFRAAFGSLAIETALPKK